MRTDNIDMQSLIEDICGNCSQEAIPRDNYSGRGMYGSKCWGITTYSNGVDVIEQAALLGLTGATMDSMGSGTIVYWPRPHFSDECEEKYTTETADEEGEG